MRLWRMDTWGEELGLRDGRLAVVEKDFGCGGCGG